MNEMNKNPLRMIFDLYNEFRLCAGLERDNSPAENVWLDDYGKPQVIKEPEDEAEFMDITVTSHIEMAFTFDMCDTDEEIKLKIKKLQEQALYHSARHWASLLWAKRSDGKPYPSISNKLNEIARCLNTYLDYEKSKSKAEVSRNQGRFKNEPGTKQRQHSTEKITPYLDRAKKLVEVSTKGFEPFINEAMKPVDKKK